MEKQTWYWIVGILILVVVGVGIYVWLSGDSSSVTDVGTNVGTIPRPPPLPS